MCTTVNQRLMSQNVTQSNNKKMQNYHTHIEGLKEMIKFPEITEKRRRRAKIRRTTGRD